MLSKLASTKPPTLETMLTEICFPQMQAVNSLLFLSNIQYETLQADKLTDLIQDTEVML